MLTACAGSSRPLRDWPEYTGGEKSRQYIFYDSLDGNWWDNSWNTWVRPYDESKDDGMRRSNAYCATIKNKVGYPL